MVLASLVSFQEQKQEQEQNIDNAFAMLMLFEEQKHQYFARRHSLNSFRLFIFKTLFFKGV